VIARLLTDLMEATNGLFIVDFLDMSSWDFVESIHFEPESRILKAIWKTRSAEELEAHDHLMAGLYGFVMHVQEATVAASAKFCGHTSSGVRVSRTKHYSARTPLMAPSLAVWKGNIVAVHVVCFDTSAINHLLEDPELPRLRLALVARRRSRLTALNVIEIARTKSDTQREALRQLEVELARGELPFEVPNAMLLAYTRALFSGTSEMEVTVSGDHRALWDALAHADAVTEDAQSELLRWTNELNQSRVRAAELLGEAVAEKLPSGSDRPNGPIPLLRQFMLRENWLKVYSLPARVVKEVTGKVLPASKLDELLAAPPGFWRVYLAAVGVQMYFDAFWHPQHGKRRKAGLLDIWAGMYLPLCDEFVTADRDQFYALRIVNVFNGRRPQTRLLTYRAFRRCLLAAG